MKRYVWCLPALLIFLAIDLHAQQVPTSRDPGTRNGVHSPRLAKTKKAKFKRRRVEHSAQYEFYQRVEEVAKEKQRILKYYDRRQFKDHRYFGHKKIPKKRPPHKMRYCNECGVRH